LEPNADETLRPVLPLVAAALVVTPAAAAHVTLNPEEALSGSFSRFVVRVPSERPVATTKVTVQLPDGLFFVSFQPKPGWKRTIKIQKLSQPVEIFGEPVRERVAEVTWSGGKINAGEFDEFGISARIPETPGRDLVFRALQTYENGELVRWIDPNPEAETPAPRVAVLPPEEDAGGAAASQSTTEEVEADSSAASGQAEAAAPEVDDGEGRSNLALVFGIAALATGLAALGLTLLRRPRRG
jgi:periplasmic copper chaperone A